MSPDGQKGNGTSRDTFARMGLTSSLPGDAGTVTHSIISGNPAATGGGISNLYGTVTVTHSTISGNTGFGGGGVTNYGGPFTVLNSTISGNSAHYGGGGVFNSGTVTVTNSTISGNSAYASGGVHSGGTNASLTLVRTLISGNTVATGPEIHNNYLGTVVANNHNLFGVDGTAGVVGFTPGPTDLVPPAGVLLADILEPTLADNRGPTQTPALVPGSPALDAGGAVCLDANGNPLTTDQLGQPRPVDGDGDGVVACDIGAFELQP